MTERPESREQTPRSAAPRGPSNAPGDPILVGDGSLDIHQTDLSLPGIARPLEFRRAYNSRSNDRSTLGSNWTHNWDVHLEVVREGTRPAWAPIYCGSTPARDMCVLLYDAQRGAQVFVLDYTTGVYLPQAGSTDTVARTRTGGWGLRRSNGDILLFDEEGYLVEDRDRFGNGFTIENEDTPLNTLFKIVCRSEAPLTETHPLWNSCAVVAGLLREGALPQAGSLPWQVTEGDLAIPASARHAARVAAEYGRAYLLYLIDGRDSAAVPFGARKKRPTRVTDDLGRTLSFVYYQAPAVGQSYDFANTPAAELLKQVTASAGVQLTFEYGEPPQYPPVLSERFLTKMSRVDAPVGPDVVAAPARSFEFKYQWPTGPTPSWPAFVPAVQQKHLAFFSTFAGCLYRDTYSCGNKSAQGKFVRAAGNPGALAAESTNEFISDIADNIIKVTHAGLVESETRYGLDPFSGSFDRALAQRYGARGAVQDLSRLPPDVPAANWEEPTLPRAAFDYVSAGPPAAGGGDRTDAVLPAQVKTRYPFEVALPSGPGRAPHGGQFRPLGANGNPPSGVVCDGASTELRRVELPGYSPEVPYFAMPDLGSNTQLKRSLLSCDQLALAQTTNAAHNDLLSSLVPLSATPEPDDYQPIPILGERKGISANNNRICGWTRFVDRDGDTTWYGLNYRGQVLVQALEDRVAPGNFLFTESLYTADGLLLQARRPTRGVAAWTSSAGHTLYEYDETKLDETEQDPARRAWNRWLPAHWTRRANLVSIGEYPAGGAVTDIAEGPAATASQRTARFTHFKYEPLFNQLQATEEGSIVGGVPVIHRRTDQVFDYQELAEATSAAGDEPIGPLLTGLEAWGFRWLRTPTAPFGFDFTLIRKWQLPPPLLNEDLNGDGVRGYFSRATSRPAAGLPILLRRRSSTIPDVVTTKVAWTAQGQPALVTNSEGDTTFFDYYETETSSQYGSTSAAPTDLTASPVNVGLLARLRVKRFGASQPVIAGLTPCPLLMGPYQYALNSNCANVQTDLTTLGLPAETIAAILDSQSSQLKDGWTTVGFSYSALGRPAVVWQDTSTVRQVLDVDGRPRETVDALGSVTVNDWDAHAYLKSIKRTSSAGAALSNTYFVRDDEGHATCTCSELTAGSCGGTCTPTSTSATASIVQRTFTPEGDLAREVDPEGLETLFAYDERKLPVREARTDPADGKTRVRVWEYSADGDLLHAGDGATPAVPRGKLAEEFLYDGFRRLSTYTDRRGYDWQLGHSARDLLTLIRRGDVKIPTADPAAAWRTRFEYDGFERVVRRSDNDLINTEWVRARSGHVVTQRQTGRGATHATYDLAGRLLWQRDAAGTETLFTWRPQPHESTATTIRRGPNGTRLTTAQIQTLNPAGLATSVVDFGSGLRRSTQLTLDGDGEVLETINPEQVRARFTRNLQGWVVTQEQQQVRGNTSLWELTAFMHDRRGDVTQVLDPNSLGTKIFYNAFGDVRRREVPNLAPVVHTFDELGRVVTRASAAGTITHLYDARGDNWKDEQAGASPVPLVVRSFDSLGRVFLTTAFNPGLTSVPPADRTVASSFTFDDAGRTTGEVRTIGGGPAHTFAGLYALGPTGTWQRDLYTPSKAWREDFDAAGRLVTKRRYSGPTLAAEGMAFEWLGELPASRAQAQGRPSPFRASVARDGFGVPTKWSYSAIDLISATAPVNAAEGTSYCGGAWDAAKCGDPLMRLDVVRDVMGRAASVQWQFANPVSSTMTARARPWRGYVHSATGRLEKSLEHAGVMAPISTSGLIPHAVVGADVETAGATAETWGYERTASVGTLTGIRSAQSNAYRWRTLVPHTGYQLNGVELDGSSRTVGHDLDGRTTQDGNRGYTFDILGQLTEVRVAGTLIESYAYDGLGRLSAVFNGPTPSETFVYDGANIVASYAANGQPRWEAVWGPGQDVLLEWVDLNAGTGAHMPLVDHRNSVVGAWGVAAGSLSKTAVYNAEGRIALSNTDGTSTCTEEGSGAVCPHPAEMPFGFGTAWRSNSTGLVSMRARWYSSQLGEFLSPDPVGYADSFNLYAYAGFDPINRWDPLGRSWNINIGPAPGAGGPPPPPPPPGARPASPWSWAEPPVGPTPPKGPRLNPVAAAAVLAFGGGFILGQVTDDVPIGSALENLYQFAQGNFTVGDPPVAQLPMSEPGAPQPLFTPGPVVPQGPLFTPGPAPDVGPQIAAQDETEKVPTVGHHSVPRQVINPRSGKKPLVPQDVADDPNVRGKPGKPNVWRIPEEVHKDIHKDGYNDDFIEGIDKIKSGGKKPTSDDVLKIRDRLVKKYDIEKYRPTAKKKKGLTR